MREALILHAEIAEEQSELDAKRRMLQELSKRDTKAFSDRTRVAQQPLGVSETTELVPTVTTENMPLPQAKIERVIVLRDQLNNLASFERPATYLLPTLIEPST